MRHYLATLLLFVLLVCLAVSSASAAPITKQNGSDPVFKDFTSICTVAGYVNFGWCGGDATKFTDIKGKVNAIQPKIGRWNLGLSFKGLMPGWTYRLWGNRDPATPSPGVIPGFFMIGDAVADANGNASFSYQTDDPNYLGFDLNILDHPWSFNGVTLVTSYWSQQAIRVLNADGTLYVPGS
jgi:hypothetical protein